MRAAILVLCLATLTVAAPVPKDTAKKRPDAEVFVGTWETVVSEVGGVPRGVSKAQWTFDAKLKMTSVSLNAPGSSHDWVIKIDPKTSPKEIEIGNYKGIYEFKGEDIRVAYTLNGARPTSFDPKPGLYYNLLQRVTNGKK